MKRVRKIILIAVGALLVLCIAATAFGAITNQSLPQPPDVLDRLDPLDASRLQETLQLRASLGETVWPGWGEADIPILLWNNQYSFLTGIPDPPADWDPVPWERFMGQVYYRQPTDDPQNFAVPVGDAWAASMATKWETDAFLIGAFREMLPGAIEAVFPFRLIIQPSEVQISGMLHETFHVYQIYRAPDRLQAAEAAHRDTDRYFSLDPAMSEDWKTEIDYLVQALKTSSDQEARQLAQAFLDQRQQRRQNHNLPTALIDYERWLEWEEGLAKYVELTVWRQAHETQSYSPLNDMQADPDFKNYQSFQQRWNQEIDQLKRQASGTSEVRFYYTGMAQGVLLDRFSPGWKERVWQDGVWVETLLAEAVQQ
jgi:hypothetical protein